MINANTRPVSPNAKRIRTICCSTVQCHVTSVNGIQLLTAEMSSILQFKLKVMVRTSGLLAFNPNNDKQLWRQDKDGRIYNKATGNVWVFDKYGSRFEAPGTDFFWDFNSNYENTKVYLEALSDQLGNRCINMGNRFHHQGTNLFLYPCKTMHPTNGCFKFKFNF